MPGESPVHPDADQAAVLALAPGASGTIAGAPGSGKTRTLVGRIEALIARGADADAIIALTPSRVTATALRDRISLATGAATQGAPARSLVSFAFQIVRAAAVGRGAAAPQLLTGADEDQIIQELLLGDAEDEDAGLSRWPAQLAAPVRATAGFRAEVRAFFAECTEQGIGPSELARLGSAADVPEWSALASFLSEYTEVRAAMRGAHRDAAGLVREAVQLLRSAPDSDLGAVGRIRTILVDDAQELTLGGVQLVEACRERGMAVLAFGDPDTSTGAFRGARPENFARLVRALGDIHVLRGAHRLAPAIGDVVRTLTQHIGAAGVVAHRIPPRDPADPDETPAVRCITVSSAAEEFDYIARALRERHVHDDVEWSQCAVIAHDTRQVAALQTELSAREVPARATGAGAAPAQVRPVRDLLTVVELASRAPADREPGELTDALLGIVGGLDPIQLRRLRTALRHAELGAGGSRSARELMASAFAHPVEFELLRTREGARAARLAKTLATLREQLGEEASAHELLWTAWQGAGVAGAWQQASRSAGPVGVQAGRDLDAVVALFQSAKRFGERRPDEDPLVYVRGMLDSSVADDRFDTSASVRGVAVLTPAQAVGCEFDTVVIAGLQDGVWPNTRLRGGLLQAWRLAETRADPTGTGAAVIDRRREALHDELRLLVRAVSRASHRVLVTAVDDDDTGPSPLFELLPEAEHGEVSHPLSLRGLVAMHRRTLTTGSGEPEHAAAQLALLADARVAGADPDEWYGILPPTTRASLRDLDEEDVRVSPSKLDQLATCQLDWVIRDLGADLGGVTAGVGILIHEAFEHASLATQLPAEDDLWRRVDARWGELEFDAAWVGRAEKTRARDLVHRLHRYLRDFAAAGGTVLGAESQFQVPVALAEPGHPHGAVLSGTIDRVELTRDGRVEIVDLKTGKSEGQTDAAVAGNAQLAAYQLAYDAGAIPGAPPGVPGGAKLLVVRPKAATKPYVTPRQPPFDEPTKEAFIARVREAADIMRGTEFLAPYEEHCRADHSYGMCRIHTVGAVSRA
ncbi:DNA helicase [Microbacterium mangrovi]|uniref:DNA 3'-5' helicase n=1 Tax=Microbacterium mangrovi TaxID=1348253 RepID=A0A0B2A7H0_9MICO|nr:DNA helicase [Microbacterium mangrovi]